MNTQSNAVLVEKQNALMRYREVDAELKKLEKEKAALRLEIFGIMDQLKTDILPWGACKAERKLIVQTRIDGKKAEEILGDRFPEIQVETSQIRLTVV